MMATTTGLTGVVFSVLSALLDYPDPSTQRALPEARTPLNATRALPLDVRAGLDHFTDKYAQRDLMTLQERYVALFDRDRAISLYLFEHVHGESRDRGQVMVDLLNMYERQGLHLRPGELPDYLSVSLEYLSRLPEKEAWSLLAETGGILQIITTRLTERANRYRFMVGAPLPLAGIRHNVSSDGESADDDVDASPSTADYRALNAAYAGEPVRFVGAETPVTELLHFHDKRPGHPRDPRGPR